jgi:uracil-DNA glycosylase
MKEILSEIMRCEVCKDHLPLGIRPVVQLSPFSKLIIIGQAPGKRVHETGIPWNDASGRKLRNWLKITEAEFYDPDLVSLLPVGFCYPGKAESGDLPPRRECAPLWHSKIFKLFQTKPLILLVGQYAQRYYLKEKFKVSLTATIKEYQEFLPTYFPLPHPSPRNQNWLKINPWFDEEVLPELQMRIRNIGLG